MLDDIDHLLDDAIAAHQARNFFSASEKYLKILEQDASHADTNHNFGLLKVELGLKEEALIFLQTAINTNPNVLQYWISFINALTTVERFDDAGSVLEQAHLFGHKDKTLNHLRHNLDLAQRKYTSDLDEPSDEQLQNLVNLYTQGQYQEVLNKGSKLLEQFPNSINLYNIIGATNKSLDKLSEAIEAYNKALSIKPDIADVHNNIGNALKSLGRLEEAMEAYKKALSIEPEFVETHNNRGNVLREQSKLDEAIEAYNKAISIKPDFTDAYNNMGIALKQQGRLEEAIEAYNKALSIKPKYAEAYNNLGIALKLQGRVDEAIEAYNKALSIKANYAEAYNNIGYAFKDEGKLEEAVETYNKAISVKPDYAEAHQNLSFVLLNNGRLKEGLDEYEWRWKTAKRLSTNRNFSQPLWDGKESLKGKTILLWSEQGVGDTINWSSCLSFVASIAEHCILECPQKLVPLLARSFPNVEVRPENRSLDAQRDDFDFHLPMGSLYRHFISEISQDSKAKAFLIPDPVRVKFWRNRLNSLGNGPYIGISWKSSNMSPQRMPNYASISDFAPIFEIPDATFINMQYNNFKDDLTKIQIEVGVKVHNFDDLDQFENLEDVAALSAALDIVVSTQSVVPVISAMVGTITKLARWKHGSWSNILFEPVGPSVNVFVRNTLDPWDDIFKSIAKDITSQIES
jgi:tetratricopeptide (TPR) repeat protein